MTANPDDMLKALLPCPFCGGGVDLEQTEEAKRNKSRDWWGVICRNTRNLGGTCAIQQRPSRTKEAAIARWNQRASIQPTDDAVAEALDEAMRRYPDDRAGLVWFAAASGLRAGEITQEVQDWALAALAPQGEKGND